MCVQNRGEIEDGDGDGDDDDNGNDDDDRQTDRQTDDGCIK